MQNCRIEFGTVKSRPGTSAVFASEGKVTALFNWINPGGDSLVLYQDGATLKSYNQTNAVSTVLLTAMTSRSPSFSPLDVWTYLCGYDTQGNGTMGVRVYGGEDTTTHLPQVDPAFRAPPSITTWTATDLIPGVCTAGTHLFGFVYQNRTGYSGKPVIADSLGNPFTITTAGTLQIKIDITLPPQTDGGASVNGGVQAKLFLIATRADNPALWYFIPTDTQTGQVGEIDVPLNASTPMTFVMNLSDEDIAASLAGDTAQANFLLTQPPDPSFVVAYGNRMCYGCGTTLYASDLQNPQSVAADLNAVRMQNQRKIGYAFQLPGNTSLYLTGDRWTGYVTDNSDSPATWAQPVQVSDALGAPLPNLVCQQTGGNYAWIVTEAGPYLFDGAYGDNPLTYLNSGLAPDGSAIGWTGVNWAANYCIQVKDDVKNLKLYIAVPMGAAGEPNAMFVIDYRMGKTFDTCDISIDVFDPVFFSSIGVVKESATGLSNLWIGPEAAGSVRRFDTSTHNDLGNPIDSYWESGLMRASETSTAMIRLGYMDLWVRGHSTLDADLLRRQAAIEGVRAVESGFGLAVVTISGDERSFNWLGLQTVAGVPAALEPGVAMQYSAKFDLARVYNYDIALGTFGIDNYFELSGLTCYSRPDLSNR